MDDQVCPRCKTTKYRNPSLKLMVNVCGHTLCDNCMEILFSKGSGACPVCNVPLRRSNFRVQLFEDPKVEKEVDIRKRILRDFNKKEEDFGTLQEYNDYLEMVEELIFNLVHNIDIINTNKRIEQYKKENKDLILKNKQKMSREEYELEQIIELEKEQAEERQKELMMIEVENRKNKNKNKEELIDSLMGSYEDANKIVEKFAQKAEEQTIALPKPIQNVPKQITQFSTGIKFSTSGQLGFLPVPKLEEGPAFVYQEPALILDGPTTPSIVEISSLGYVQHIRSETPGEKTGGFKTNISCLRAIQDAMAGLYYNIETM